MEPNVGEEGGWWVEEVNGPTSNVALYVRTLGILLRFLFTASQRKRMVGGEWGWKGRMEGATGRSFARACGCENDLL